MQCKENSCIFTNFCYKLKYIRQNSKIQRRVEIPRDSRLSDNSFSKFWRNSLIFFFSLSVPNGPDNVGPEVDSGNPLTFGINPLGDHRRRHVSDDSGYEGGDNEEDQTNGSPIKVNNPLPTNLKIKTNFLMSSLDLLRQIRSLHCPIRKTLSRSLRLPHWYLKLILRVKGRLELGFSEVRYLSTFCLEKYTSI